MRLFAVDVRTVVLASVVVTSHTACTGVTGSIQQGLGN